MSSLMKVMIIGRLGNDPETAYNQSGNAVTKISIATSMKWKDKNTGEPREETEWTRVVFFGKQAEAIAQYTKKGSRLYIEGRLKTSSYDKNGVKTYSTDVISNSFKFLDSAQDPQQAQTTGAGSTSNMPAGAAAAARPSQSTQTPVQSQPQGFDSFDDDIPFS